MDILNQNSSKAEIRKNEKDDEAGLNHLYFDNIHVDKEGSIVLSGEEFWTEKKEHTDASGRVNITYEYHYADILATK